MRFLLILSASAISIAAQSPTAQMINVSRPSETKFQVGDRFRIVITGAPNQPVSVRTTMTARTDWGPVIGQTDANGQWSTTGQFEKSDFGGWSEAWTVGGVLANPAINFSVDAPCLDGGQRFIMYLGAPHAETCQTLDGTKNFVTPSDSDSFRTPDGRVVPGRSRSNMTAEEFHMEVLQALVLKWQDGISPRLYGDEAAALMTKMIGTNALTEQEMRNSVEIIHAAYEKPNRIPPAALDPAATLLLLQRFANAAQDASLKQQIAETANFVQLQ